MSRLSGLPHLLIALLVALLTPLAHPTTARADDPLDPDSPVAITEGSLVWGIKESWRSYIGEDGTATEGGASRTAEGLFSFPLMSGTFDPATKTTRLTFAGSVHFTAYCSPTCLLDTRYGNLTVELSPERQVISGDWTGRLRESPSDPPQSATGVDLAQLEISGLNPSFSQTETNWQSVPSLATADFVTYPEGTRLDPVTISYTGPGAAPPLPERWDNPGAPLYEPGARWISDKTESNARLAYPSADGSVVLIVQGATNTADPARAHRIIPVDPITLEPVGAEVGIPEPAFDSMLRTAFDPDAAAVYWPELTTVAATDGTQTRTMTIHRAAWDDDEGRLVTSVVGTLPSSAYAFDRIQISSLLWNRHTHQLAVISGVYSPDDPETTLTLFSPAEGGWSSTDDPLELPQELRDSDNGARLSIPFGLSGTTQNLAVLPDGSYLLAGGGSATVTAADGTITTTPIPAFRLQLGAGSVQVSAVVGSEPVDRTYGAGHGFASTTADGTVLLSNSQGAYRPVSLVDGELVVGEEFTFSLNGNAFGSPTVAADPVTGLTITTNTSAQKLLFSRGSTLIGSQDAPGVNGILPTSVTIGPDGSLYLQSRTAEGFGAIARWDLVDIVPELTTQPQPVTIRDCHTTARATFTVDVAPSPLPQKPTIQWQRSEPGSDEFVDLAGQTGSQLTLTVTTHDSGARFRAIISSSAGRIASQPAGLTVQG